MIMVTFPIHERTDGLFKKQHWDYLGEKNQAVLPQFFHQGEFQKEYNKMLR